MIRTALGCERFVQRQDDRRTRVVCMHTGQEGACCRLESDCAARVVGALPFVTVCVGGVGVWFGLVWCVVVRVPLT